jgi:hypothetical protein
MNKMLYLEKLHIIWNQENMTRHSNAIKKFSAEINLRELNIKNLLSLYIIWEAFTLLKKNMIKL